MHRRRCLAVTAFLMLVAVEWRAARGRPIEYGLQSLDGLQAEDIHIDGQAADWLKEQRKRGAALENEFQTLPAEAADQFQCEDVFLQRAKVARPQSCCLLADLSRLETTG